MSPCRDVGEYVNQQKSLEPLVTLFCLHCNKRLKPHEEYLCDKCFTKAMKEDMKAQAEAKEEEIDDWNENWRFTDNRGRSVFNRDL